VNDSRRWFNTNLPQTLQMGVALLYLNAAFDLLGGLLLLGSVGTIELAFFAGQAAGAYGIANERRVGYALGVASALAPLVFLVWAAVVAGIRAVGVLDFAFQLALVALLLHRQSREYARLWFH
jgi:hypothetical protein